MEPQTRFDLSAALQTWREELAEQVNLTPEARRELETHVRDTVAEMQQRGLNDEESFWLARRRVGQPKELVAEFAKAEPSNPGRQWVLWTAVALYVFVLWEYTIEYLFIAITIRLFRASSSTEAYLMARSVNYLFMAFLGVYVARNRSQMKFTTWLSFIRCRGRTLAVCSFLAFAGLEYALLASSTGLTGASPQKWEFMGESLVWPSLLVALILWLLPSEKSPAAERA